MEEYYYLKDKDRDIVYVKELVSSHTLDDAMKFRTLRGLLLFVPVWRDWNIDFKVYKYSDGEHELVEDEVWDPIYKEFKKENNFLYE